MSTNQLSPAQRDACKEILAALPCGNIFELRCKPGRGRTTVLTQLHVAMGGTFLTAKEFVNSLGTHHPLALEEAFYDVVFAALREYDHVIVDDLHVVTAVMRGACHFYPRTGLLASPMTVLAGYAAATGKHLIFGGDGQLPDAISHRAYSFAIKKFTREDYAHLCMSFLGEERTGRLDLEKVYRFAPNLNAHQLRVRVPGSARATSTPIRLSTTCGQCAWPATSSWGK